MSLSVCITLWEFIEINSLMSDDRFYTLATDIISILTVVACAIRLPTYCICDITFRKELWFMMRNFCSSCRKKIYRKLSYNTSIQKRISHRRATMIDERLLEMARSKPKTTNRPFTRASMHAMRTNIPLDRPAMSLNEV